MKSTVTSKEMVDFCLKYKSSVSYDVESGIITTPKGTHGVSRGKTGYLSFKLHGRVVQVHTFLSAIRFGASMVGFQINHIDGNKLNNRSENLELVTPRENVQHEFRTGLYKHPSKCEYITQQRIPKGDVPGLRELWREGKLNVAEVAERYGITHQAVYAMLHGKNYRFA